MNYKRTYLLLLSFLSVLCFRSYSQNEVTPSAAITTNSTSFTYPQSIFVDNPNGHIWLTDFDNNRILRFDVSLITFIEKRNSSILKRTFLSQNYPNPFNPDTQISFSIEKTGFTVMRVYNVLGQRVATLFEEIANAHTIYTVSFGPKNLPSGLYMYSLHTPNGNVSKKMCFLK